MGLDARESTPGFKRQLVVLNSEVRSCRRASIVAERVLGRKVSANTIERICLDAAEDLAGAEQRDWNGVLDGEVPVPTLAIIAFDGGRIRTRKAGCGPGVHLESTGWNETKNALFASATSTPCEVDPQPDPPRCFLDSEHVAKLAESASLPNQRGPEEPAAAPDDEPPPKAAAQDRHQPRRLLRTLLSSLEPPKLFGKRMRREARRRRFDSAPRKAFVGDGLPCNWKLQRTHFPDYVAILDFVHAVSHLFAASVACFGKTEAAWSAYQDWMTRAGRGDIAAVLAELQSHRLRLGAPPAAAGADDPRERLRLEIGYFEHNRERMDYARHRREGLPTTSAWMESAVKELNYRVKGTEMFWNNPRGAEAILHIRAAALCDDDRLTRLLTHRPGQPQLRRLKPARQAT